MLLQQEKHGRLCCHLSHLLKATLFTDIRCSRSESVLECQNWQRLHYISCTEQHTDLKALHGTTTWYEGQV